jgi:hypothetical protein
MALAEADGPARVRGLAHHREDGGADVAELAGDRHVARN